MHLSVDAVRVVEQLPVNACGAVGSECMLQLTDCEHVAQMHVAFDCEYVVVH